MSSWRKLRKEIEVAAVQVVNALLRLGKADAGLQPRNHPPTVAVPGLVAGLLLGEGERGVYADIVVSGDPERGRHHAHNAIGCAVQPDIFTNHVRVACEQVLPQALGKHRDLLLAQDGLLFGERAPQQRPHAQHLEERRRHVLPLDALRGSLHPDFVARILDERHFAEDVGHLAAVQVIGDAVRAAVDAHAGVAVVHRHQPLGLRERQPPQNHVFENREDGRIGADREASVSSAAVVNARCLNRSLRPKMKS